MAITHLPESLANADRSLSSVITVGLQANLDQCHAQSCWGLGVLAGAVGWTYATYAADVWEHVRFSVASGMPIPLRPKRDGTWRDVAVSASVKSNAAVKVRAYLLGRASVNRASVSADPEGFTGVDSYDQVTVDGDGNYHDCVWEIAPGDCEVRSGDGSVSGIALPVAWLHWIAMSADVDCEWTLRAPSIEETL